MQPEYKPKYSGPNCSGICVCGHSWQEHHLSIVMKEEYFEQTHEAYFPDECCAFGFNEAGGMKYNEETGGWEVHCYSYRDSLLTSIQK